jgi:hypothetical protein
VARTARRVILLVGLFGLATAACGSSSGDKSKTDGGAEAGTTGPGHDSGGAKSDVSPAAEVAPLRPDTGTGPALDGAGVDTGGGALDAADVAQSGGAEAGTGLETGGSLEAGGSAEAGVSIDASLTIDANAGIDASGTIDASASVDSAGAEAAGPVPMGAVFNGTAVTFTTVTAVASPLHIDVTGSDGNRTFTLDLYVPIGSPLFPASYTFPCGNGRGTVNFTQKIGTNAAETSPATAGACTAAFTMIPTSNAGGRLVGGFSGTVGTTVITDGVIDVMVPPS